MSQESTHHSAQPSKTCDLERNNIPGTISFFAVNQSLCETVLTLPGPQSQVAVLKEYLSVELCRMPVLQGVVPFFSARI